MIKVIEAKYKGNFEIALVFSDNAASPTLGHPRSMEREGSRSARKAFHVNSEGVFDGKVLLKHQGPLLDALREEKFFKRFFIDMGALCWPNGLELSPAKLYDICVLETA